jgi:predicted transglutaminase-like cysteine proteinase
MELEQYIAHIEDKVQQLVRKLHATQAANEKLSDQLVHLQEQLVEKEGIIDLLDKELKTARITIAARSKGLTEDEAAFRKEIRAQINEYIKEIDKCISLLNT